MNISVFKEKALLWANQFEVCCFLDSNGYQDQYSEFDFAIACGVQKECIDSSCQSFKKLEEFNDLNNNWLFGLLSYDLKNEVEKLESNNVDRLKFPTLYFFLPKYLIVFKDGQLDVVLGDEKIIDDINKLSSSPKIYEKQIELECRLAKHKYIETVENLREHIIKGNIYEINFCQEFFAENASINPADCFTRLNQLSPNPFSGYFKIYDKFILSASPERFLCKRIDKLIAQPIKGTARRYKNIIEDNKAISDLQTNIKEKAENVMIVDLTRNDLTKICKKGSIEVEELFAVYSFPQVHQMISTVTGSFDEKKDFIDIFKNTFPMGSMTGAPKLRAMELIEKYESTKRGIFSGSIGYITPDNNFDFNVVIRTILYNSTAKYLSVQVGSAITFLSEAEREYDECLLKAEAMFSVLNHKTL
ncbi:para-aminobenzoate synthetase component 1 [Pedobacter sp. UYEF25]